MIHDTPAFQQLEKGIIKTDEFMQKNKTLATMSAVAVSGLAIGQWLRMSFSGDIESDFDLSIIPQAFAGEAGFKELIATPDGIKGMGLLSLGLATGGLPIWMGGATGLAMALTYSGLQSAGETEKGKELKDKMVKWAESMGGAIEKGTKAVDKKLGLDKNNEVKEMRIESIQNLDDLKCQFDAKKVKTKDLEKHFESKTFTAGKSLKIAKLPWGKLGMSICYDLRFPNMFRNLAQKGSLFISVPSYLSVYRSIVSAYSSFSTC